MTNDNKQSDHRSKVQNGRDENGRWVQGYTPEGAKPYKPGESGNPTGRKTYGAYASEWMNSMATWTEEQLLKVIGNRKNEPAAKVAAAQRVLNGICDEKLGSEDFDRCCNRTDGRPTQRREMSGPGGRPIEMNRTDERSLEKVKQCIKKLLERGEKDESPAPRDHASK